MRKQVLDTEVAQFKATIHQLYNAGNKPSITVIIVNKRISQRFFVKNEKGQLVNAPSGTVIDTNVVQSEE